MTFTPDVVPVLTTTVPTLSHFAQIVLAATMPLATWLVLGKSKVRTVKWFDMLRLIGGLLVPTAALLAMQGVLPPLVAGAIVATMLGHTATHVDTD